ncbi:MAG: bifunctional DNA-formamidopyrimidine glycosylase/DNA-(apurinic or apyrimidinic site) lyase [Chloroflexi bacterium]|nr:bifunctional DNA-formamidopyrimidine glycosylase/DNA-(apurinic or apyrimidinic site) lyase [Chloroflexota bacterium]
MPELPEVETIRRDLERHVVGRRFVGVKLTWPGCIDRPSSEAFERLLPGRRIEAVERRGKFLILRLDDGWALAVHLRMTGRLTRRSQGSERGRHLRAVLRLDDGHELQFEDQRKFGRLYLVPDAAALADVLAKLGPEPLAATFTVDDLRALVRRRHTALKPLLLDQRAIAGLGNIYVDEALFRAGLHPLRRTETLSDDGIRRLHAGIVEALEQGIRNRGTTLSSYRDAWGTAGLNQEQLLVFRREGTPCPRCGTPIEKMRVAGRGTHYCPRCQPLSRQ